MKAIFINKNKFSEIELVDPNFKDEFIALINDFKILESNIIYFSAGESKIKEILLKKEPSFSV